jgi:hypothetical protein
MSFGVAATHVWLILLVLAVAFVARDWSEPEEEAGPADEPLSGIATTEHDREQWSVRPQAYCDPSPARNSHSGTLPCATR